MLFFLVYSVGATRAGARCEFFCYGFCFLGVLRAPVSRRGPGGLFMFRVVLSSGAATLPTGLFLLFCFVGFCLMLELQPQPRSMQEGCASFSCKQKTHEG